MLFRSPKVDADGYVVDVHAMRHTTAAHLAKAGVAPRTAQAILRHSDIRLTFGSYTDPRLLDTREALDALPSFMPAPDPKRLRATGTMNHTASADAKVEALGVLLGGEARPSMQNHSAQGANTPSKADSGRRSKSPVIQELATKRMSVQHSGRSDSNRRRPAWEAGSTEIQPAENTSTYDTADGRLAFSLADSLKSDPDWMAVTIAWPTLPQAIKTGIVAMVKASGGMAR